MRRILGACAFLMAAGLAAADDKKPDPPKGEEVSGKVALDGVALTGATVTFVSKDGKTTVAAEVKNGAYKATVPAGEYAVGVASVPPPKGKDPKDPPKDPGKFLPVVPTKYGDPKTSGITAKVAAGKNEINFELKSK
jgi:hypothetical protein